ncbi:MAG: 5'-deoxynucleotidase [Clostridiales bacterium]|nr:5'-deoxynucleotidase [Clostridiales bacterium]
MGGNHFFAMLSRMKYINRWALMRNTFEENLSVHSHETAAFAHALALIGNRRFGREYNAERAALLGLYHDAHEILTGDMPTPVKYLNPEILGAFKGVESSANEKLMNMLPEDLRADYEPLLTPCEDDASLRLLVKAADKLSALVKCIEERKAGNSEFKKAEQKQLKALAAMKLPEVDAFIAEFMPSYEFTLDQLN